MTIELTSEQWTSLQQVSESPVRVQSPTGNTTFVLLPTEVYERYKSLFESDPVTQLERQFQLQEFGKRAGWNDPEMDIYNDLDPRRKT